MIYHFFDFRQALHIAKWRLKWESSEVPVGHWQGIDAPMPTVEVFNHLLCCNVNPDLDVLKEQIQPNLPWADDHFMERVGGEPLNPPPSSDWWPFAQRGNKEFKEQDKFTHTYPERFWPRWAGSNVYKDGNRGIRYRYGDLNDVIKLLVREPLTRQAYLPIWFPEDTGAVHGGRVPCTLGYHFMRRGNELHMFYTIRSCDFVRHFRDDIYLTCRLLLWVLNELKESDPKTWDEVVPGDLTMHIYSLHIFTADRPLLD